MLYFCSVGDSFRDREVLFGYPGLGNGLTVELSNELDDYFYTKQASLGANVPNNSLTATCTCSLMCYRFTFLTPWTIRTRTAEA
jgi:hypothetical protein